MTELTIEQIHYLGRVRVVLRKHHNQDTELYKHIVEIMDYEKYSISEAHWLNTTVKNYYLSKVKYPYLE